MKNWVPLVSYAVQSKGPVLSGLMLNNAPALLSAYLERAGYRPVIFDFNNVDSVGTISKSGKGYFINECTDLLDDFIKEKEVKILGFNLYTNGFSDSVSIAEELKKRNPELVITGGGPQVNWYGKLIRNRTDAFDILSPGYSDGAIVGIADHVYDKKTRADKIPGMKGGLPEKSESRMNDLPFPLYDEDVYLNIGSKIKVPVVEDSRGCPYSKCSFCIHPKIGGKHRERDEEMLAGEIRHNLETYGFRVSRLSGPSPGSGYINRLADMLPEGCMISAFGSSEGSYDFGKIRGKVLAIFLGVESADKEMLEKLMRKTGNADEYLARARETIDGLKGEGISTITSMIIPSADETSESMDRSMDFLYETGPDFAPVLPLSPMADTPLVKGVFSGRIRGMEIDDNYKERMMEMDIDLLQPPEMWPDVPWKTRVNGEWKDNPFSVSREFSSRLMEHGMYPLSDEIVLMAHLYHGSLGQEQKSRRGQCLDFMAAARKHISEGNAEELRKMVNQINRNQVRG